jgi:hypothetical protein
MRASTDDSAIPDHLWRVWAAQGKRKRATIARKVWAMVVVLFLLGIASYFLVR